MAPGSGRFAGFSGRERGQSGVDTGVFWIVGRDDPEVVPGISFSHKAGVSSSTTNLRDQFTGRSRGKESSSLCTAPEHGGRREIDDSRYIFRKSSTDDLPGKTSGTHTRAKLSKNRERKHQNRSRKTKKCSGGFEMVVLFFWLYPVILKEYQ